MDGILVIQDAKADAGNRQVLVNPRFWHRSLIVYTRLRGRVPWAVIGRGKYGVRGDPAIEAFRQA